MLYLTCIKILMRYIFSKRSFWGMKEVSVAIYYRKVSGFCSELAGLSRNWYWCSFRITSVSLTKFIYCHLLHLDDKCPLPSSSIWHMQIFPRWRVNVLLFMGIPCLTSSIRKVNSCYPQMSPMSFTNFANLREKNCILSKYNVSCSEFRCI